MPKGAGLKTPMVPRVSTIPVVMSEGMPDEMFGRDQHS